MVGAVGGRHAFRVVRGRDVLLLDTPLEPRLHKQNRLWQPGRVMGDTPDTRHIHAMYAP